jgi:hypothetical protein
MMPILFSKPKYYPPSLSLQIHRCNQLGCIILHSLCYSGTVRRRLLWKTSDCLSPAKVFLKIKCDEIVKLQVYYDNHMNPPIGPFLIIYHTMIAFCSKWLPSNKTKADIDYFTCYVRNNCGHLATRLKWKKQKTGEAKVL